MFYKENMSEYLHFLATQTNIGDKVGSFFNIPHDSERLL